MIYYVDKRNKPAGMGEFGIYQQNVIHCKPKFLIALLFLKVRKLSHHLIAFMA